ncbi:recombinase family protein [Tsukamurella tyrosinosolvens]|uniref:recombinase family protein n=1 Tax=Tsukamurella tyrosinosolvens TaxID=57704 RepID=UPI001CE19DC5|nr:recombinase family protein [Tsukamurella tyrosinosolvens]MCA4995084.1 recombinase family protein [Tsukamurella tyrosinosolvens]
MSHNRIRPLRAVLYSRISEDPKRTGLGVQRQQQDCTALSKRMKFRVVANLCDNDKSAWKESVRRPDYEQLLEMVAAGEVDVIVAYKIDRIGRRLRTLIDLYELLLKHNVTIHLVAGDIDLTTSHGIAMAQMAAVMSENYVRTSREANLRGRVELAERGVRHCTRRPYGWEPGGLKVRPHEADVVREIVQRIIASQSPTSIARDLNHRSIPTAEGKRWTGVGVRKCAARASNAAIREHNGTLHYNGQWEPIISHDDYAAVTTALDERQLLVGRRGPGRKYLLTGFVFCGECGAKLGTTNGVGHRADAYRCYKRRSNDPLEIGCGRVSRNIAPLDHLISEAVLTRLDSPQMLDAINQASSADNGLAELLKQRHGYQESLDRLLADYYAPDNMLSPDQFRKIKAEREQQIGDVDQRISRMSYATSLKRSDLAGNLREVWASASIEWRRSVIDMLVDKVIVNRRAEREFKRVSYEGWRFDPELIDVVWKV